MLGHLRVSPVEFRVEHVSSDHTGLEVVDHQPGWDGPEELERGDMRFGPRHRVHLEHWAHEHVPTAGQHHHERPHPPGSFGHRVNPRTEEPVIDLGLAARVDDRAGNRHQLLVDMGRELEPDIATERRDRHLQVVFVTEALMHGRDRVRRQHRLDAFTMLVDHRERQTPRFRINQLREPARHQTRPFRPR
jgi:hypothetical protein